MLIPNSQKVQGFSRSNPVPRHTVLEKDTAPCFSLGCSSTPFLHSCLEPKAHFSVPRPRTYPPGFAGRILQIRKSLLKHKPRLPKAPLLQFAVSDEPFGCIIIRLLARYETRGKARILCPTSPTTIPRSCSV